MSETAGVHRACWRDGCLAVAGHAQQSDKKPIVAFLGASTASLASERVAAFEQRLGELGWIKGHTVMIEYRWAEGHFDRSADIIADFVRSNVDVIVTHATANIIAAKKATAHIPIVFAVAAID